MSFVFPEVELNDRRSRARELMREKNIDMLLITNEENFIHLTGLQGGYGKHMSTDRPGILFFPVSGKPMIITSELMSAHLMSAYPEWDIFTYSNIGTIPRQLILDVIDIIGRDIDTIGIEAGSSQRVGMTYNKFQDLINIVDAKITDASDVIWELRMKKTATEIEYLKESAEIVSQARQSCLNEIESGVTYRQIAQIYSRELLKLGADRTAFTILGSTQQSEITELPEQIYRVLFPDICTQPGEILFFDAGAFVQTHTVDYNRWAVFDHVDSKIEKYHDIVKNVSDRMGEAIAPGVLCSELHTIAVDALQQADAIDSSRSQAGRMGHGQGMYWAEPPSISPVDDTELREGFVISTEPYAVKDDIWMVWEDVWVVTSNGSERITSETSELRVI